MSKLTSILEHHYFKDSKYVFVHNCQNLRSPRRGEHLIQERQDDKKEVINSLTNSRWFLVIVAVKTLCRVRSTGISLHRNG